MNIFILDEDPVKAAQMLCDKHAGGKMAVESAQMLCTAHRMLDGIQTTGKSKSGKTTVKKWVFSDPEKESLFYKAVHINHPCTVWTRFTSENYKWHYEHFIALCDEYSHRYNKTHLTDSLLRSVLSKEPNNIPNGNLTQFPLAMNSEPQCIHSNDPVRSYREFYQTKKKRFKMVWTNRQKPEWFCEG